MRKLVFVLLLLVLALPTSLFAADEGDRSCQLQDVLEQIRAETDVLIFDENAGPDLDLLFYRLPADSELDENGLELEAFVGGKSLLLERIRPIESEAATAGGAIELLSQNPQQLTALHRLGRSGAELEISLRYGSMSQSFSYEELVAQSNELREALPDLLLTRTELVSSRLQKPAASDERIVPLHKDQCTDWCDDEQYDCYLYRCGQFGSASCYNACDIQWEDCLESCGICQPDTTTTTTVTLFSVTDLGPVECKNDPYWVGNSWYIWSKIRYKKTVTTTTTNADCSQTVTTSVTYIDIYCWRYYAYDPNCYVIWPAYNFC